MKYDIVKSNFSLFLFIIAFIFSGCMPEDTKSKGYRPTYLPALKHELIIGVHPYLNAKKTFFAYEPIVRYLEKNIPDTHFQLETSVDYADYERKLYAGHFDMVSSAELNSAVFRNDFYVL